LNSNFGGVQVGINAPYSFHDMPDSADDMLNYVKQTNISAFELRSQPVEKALGAKLVARPSGAERKKGFSPEQQAARNEATLGLEKWRLSQSMSAFKEFRKKYEDAGVKIQIVKWDDINTFSDPVLDYCFQMAAALGAHAISCEIPVSQTKRLGEFAAKHKMMVGYHGHGNITDPEAFGALSAWERSMEFSKYNGANIDIGHFFAANGFSPAEWIKKNHQRVTHVHLKDRKAKMGAGMPWGQGDTPIKEILLMMKKEKYKFQATIELEYKIPEGSNVLAEVTKCVNYCKEVLS
jgi:sugar phosphate isomerase/epimerase